MVKNGIYWTCGQYFLRDLDDDMMRRRIVDTFERCMNRYQFVPLDEMWQYDDNDVYPLVGKDHMGNDTYCGYSVCDNLDILKKDFAMFIFVNDKPVSKAKMKVVLSGSDEFPPGIEILLLCGDSSNYSSAGKNMIKNAIELNRCISVALRDIQVDMREPQVSLFSVNDSFYDRHTPLEKNKGTSTFVGGQRGSRATNEWLRSVRPVSARPQVVDLTQDENPDEIQGSGLTKPGRDARRRAASLWCI